MGQNLLNGQRLFRSQPVLRIKTFSGVIKEEDKLGYMIVQDTD